MKRWMRKASLLGATTKSDSPHRNRNREETAYLSVRHLFPHEVETNKGFEVDASFLEVLRNGQEDEEPDPMDRFKKYEENHKSLWRDPFFKEDDAKSAQNEKRRSLSWCSEPWESTQGEEDVGQDQKPAPPPPPRTVSTFKRISAMFTRPFSRKPPAPQPPPRRSTKSSGPNYDTANESLQESSDEEEDEEGFDKYPNDEEEDCPPPFFDDLDDFPEEPRASQMKPVKQHSNRVSFRRRSDITAERLSSSRRSSTRAPPPPFPKPMTTGRSSGKSPKSLLVNHMQERRRMIASTASEMPSRQSVKKAPVASSSSASSGGGDASSMLLAQIRARRIDSYKAPERRSTSTARSSRRSKKQSMRSPPPTADDDVDLSKYKLMLKAGLPEGAVYQKMMIEGVDPALLGLSF